VLTRNASGVEIMRRAARSGLRTALRELGLIRIAANRRGVPSRLRSDATEIVLRIAV